MIRPNGHLFSKKACVTFHKCHFCTGSRRGPLRLGSATTHAFEGASDCNSGNCAGGPGPRVQEHSVDSTTTILITTHTKEIMIIRIIIRSMIHLMDLSKLWQGMVIEMVLVESTECSSCTRGPGPPAQFPELQPDALTNACIVALSSRAGPRDKSGV